MIDAIDEKLIEILMKDAHQSSVTLAKQLGVSSSTIRRRIKRLYKQGVMRIVARPESDKIGFSLRVVIALDVIHEKVGSVLKILSERTDVHWLSATSGRFNIIAIVWFPSTDKFYEFTENVTSRLQGVRNIETFICLTPENVLSHL
jgi:DNA-binding Lrp family transcriptional regulator